MLLKADGGNHQPVNITSLYTGAGDKSYALVPKFKVDPGAKTVEILTADGDDFGICHVDQISNVDGVNKDDVNALSLIELSDSMTQTVGSILEEYTYLDASKKLIGNGENSKKIGLVGNDYAGEVENETHFMKTDVTMKNTISPILSLKLANNIDDLRNRIGKERLFGLPARTLCGDYEGPILCTSDKKTVLGFYGQYWPFHDSQVGKYLGLREVSSK